MALDFAFNLLTNSIPLTACYPQPPPNVSFAKLSALKEDQE
jgi:hypothetical protein